MAIAWPTTERRRARESGLSKQLEDSASQSNSQRSADPIPRPHIPITDRLTVRLAISAGLSAGSAAGVALWLATGAFTAGVWVGAAAVMIVTAAVTHHLINIHIAQRLDLARNALREARKRRFEALAALPNGTHRDEVDALILQVYRTGRALQDEIERLEKAEGYRRDFLGDVSHELRTPIFAVTGFAETLLDGALDDDRVRTRFVEKILSNADRLDSLTRDLTAIADLETGRLALHREPVDLRQVAQETIDALAQSAASRDVTLSLSIPADLPHALADRAKLRQVLSNLIENATKYNKTGGTVEVVARTTGPDRVRIAVNDNGIGIPQKMIPRLTERFFRVDKSRSREQGGTGLGLAIVKHILEAHGQSLSIESRPGYGSSFAFSLPTARDWKRQLSEPTKPASVLTPHIEN